MRCGRSLSTAAAGRRGGLESSLRPRVWSCWVAASRRADRPRRQSRIDYDPHGGPTQGFGPNCKFIASRSVCDFNSSTLWYCRACVGGSKRCGFVDPTGAVCESLQSRLSHVTSFSAGERESHPAGSSSLHEDIGISCNVIAFSISTATPSDCPKITSFGMFCDGVAMHGGRTTGRPMRSWEALQAGARRTWAMPPKLDVSSLHSRTGMGRHTGIWKGTGPCSHWTIWRYTERRIGRCPNGRPSSTTLTILGATSGVNTENDDCDPCMACMAVCMTTSTDEYRMHICLRFAKRLAAVTLYATQTRSGSLS